MIKTIASACLLLIALTSQVRAQDVDASPCNNNSDNAKRISELISSLSEIEVTGDKYYNLNTVYSLLVSINRNVRTREDIKAFRCRDDLQTILKLVSFALIDERAVRVNASLLLANVVDNTTLCGVLDELLGHRANDSAQYNLWQVVLVVTGYARVENKKWIAATIRDNREFLKDTAKYAKTLQLLQDIEAALAKNTRTATLVETYPDQYKACVTLPKIAALEEQAPPQ